MGINRVGDFWLKKNKEVTPPPLPTRPSQREMSGSDYFEKDFGRSRVQLIQDILDRLGPAEVNMDSGTDIEELVRQTPRIRQELHHYDEAPARERIDMPPHRTSVKTIMIITGLAVAYALGYGVGEVAGTRKQDATSQQARPKEEGNAEADEKVER